MQEQKEEKEVKRNLPKIEKELRQMVQEYDNLHGKYSYKFYYSQILIDWWIKCSFNIFDTFLVAKIFLKNIILNQ